MGKQSQLPGEIHLSPGLISSFFFVGGGYHQKIEIMKLSLNLVGTPMNKLEGNERVGSHVLDSCEKRI
jgi:hypothetical protein